MVKKIFHLADVHIPNYWDSKRPYDEMLKTALASLYDECKELNEDEFRIVVSGDIFDGKAKPSPEARRMYVIFLNYLNAMGKTFILAGNHDMIKSNQSRLDSLSPIFELNGALENVHYIDKLCDYKSGCVIDDNIVWVLYSMFDQFKTPEDLEIMKNAHPDKKFVALYHGDIVGAKSDTGRVCGDGLPFDNFNGCNCAMLGHIHKYQEIKKNGIPFVYSGSLIQQNYGENTTQHGFVVWDMESEPLPTHKLVEVENDYRLYKIKITSYDDIEQDVEKLMNL